MLKSILLCTTIFFMIFACTESTDTLSQSEISTDIDWVSLPWVDQQSELSVTLYDANGSSISASDEFVSGKEYQLVVESGDPLAILVDANYGIEWLDPAPESITEQTSHHYRISKDPASGINNIIFQVIPMYYEDDEIIRELPQAFVLLDQNN